MANTKKGTYYLIEDVYGFILMDEETYGERIKHCARLTNFPKSAGFDSKEKVLSYIKYYVPALRDIKIIVGD